MIACSIQQLAWLTELALNGCESRRIDNHYMDERVAKVILVHHNFLKMKINYLEFLGEKKLLIAKCKILVYQESVPIQSSFLTQSLESA